MKIDNMTLPQHLRKNVDVTVEDTEAQKKGE